MNPALTHIHDTLHAIKSGIQQDIIGQDALIEKLIITFFAGGHALLEWVPGLGKTKTIRTFAQVLGLDTGRVTFTPDLLPSDLTGSEIYRQGKWSFEVRKWPIFTHILLADEINRTPPKVQSALLEAMEEKKVTIGDTTLDLPAPFVVFATQNPLEHEGTYPLPEAQLDRFLMRIILDYPSKYDEKKILMQESGTRNIDDKSQSGVRGEGTVWAKMIADKKDKQSEEEWVVLPLDSFGTFATKSTGNSVYEKISPTDLLEMIDYIAKSIRVDEKIYDYVGDILSNLRSLAEHTDNKKRVLNYGPSTRAWLALIRTSRIHALMNGRDYVIPEDIKSLAHDILDHRIWLSYEALSEWLTEQVITSRVLDEVRVP